VLACLYETICWSSHHDFGPSVVQEVDAIIHNGAHVNSAYSYYQLKDANVRLRRCSLACSRMHAHVPAPLCCCSAYPQVGGTLECLRLAAAGSELMTIQYVSTVGMLPPNPGGTTMEDTVLQVATGGAAGVAMLRMLEGGHWSLLVQAEILLPTMLSLLPQCVCAQDPASLVGSGYNQTKWCGEQLVLQAQRKGLPAKVVRLGRIGGSSQTGAFNNDDMLLLQIRGKWLAI
jgi:nucleoside-diphosphate-sugar epimerase